MKYLNKSVTSLVLCCAALAASAHAADTDMKAMMEQGHQKMVSMPMTDKPDIDFAMMMREHHMGALKMAQWQLDHGTDAKMKKMAREIIAGQKKEIAQFDQYLARNGHPLGGQGMDAGGAPGHGHSK